MARFVHVLKSIATTLINGVAGFVAGIIVAWFALTFLGVLQNTNDLSPPELEQEIHSRWVALYIACGAAIAAMVFGRARVPRFWLRFVVAFGVICVIPFWPSKAGTLAPFGTPYVNFGFQPSELVLLAVHVSIALAVAALLSLVRSKVQERRRP